MEPHAQSNPTSYVLGFAFEMLGAEPAVCLIVKNKPQWQAGHLNGVGGKIEDGETPNQAMAREFLEETGVNVEEQMWHHFYTMRFRNGAIVYCFTTQIHDQPRTMTDEVVQMHILDKHGRWHNDLDDTPAIRNLNWVIPMAYQELNLSVTERLLVS